MSEQDKQEPVEISDRSIQEKIKDFSTLLKQIETTNDKKKQLWKEIYENAICDRQNAYIMFVKLVMIVQDKSTEHVLHGRSLSSYIERMSKANDQLIKLAELVAKSEAASEAIDPDELFNKIRDN
jgi:CRISPR/Cas system-associated endonuclease Cas1